MTGGTGSASELATHSDVRPCAGVLICPVCGADLFDDEGGRTLRCERRHAFDRAKEGHVDLLPAGHGRTRLRGDTRDMVAARRRFLERGHFELLGDAIVALATTRLPARDDDDAHRPLTVVDAGCGEGYYIGRLAKALGTGVRGRCLVGLDVSKAAVRQAARSHPGVTFVLNDVKGRLSIADGAADLLLDVFAPRNPAEFARVMRPGGLLLVAIPHDDHLAELRTRLPLLGIEPDKRARTLAQFADAFDPEPSQALRYSRVLEGDEVLDLLRMTPNRWHVDDATLAGVAEWSALEVGFAVDLLCLRRRGAGGAPSTQRSEFT